jgi:predicted nuclease of predicted toxin-antitoxin system
MARFKVDENLPDSVARVLRAAGHDATTVIEQGLGGQADAVVAAACRQEGRTLLTLDRQFGNLRRYPPAGTPGAIVLRTASQEVEELLGLVRRVVATLPDHPVEGTIWIVDTHRIRIRRG